MFSRGAKDPTVKELKAAKEAMLTSRTFEQPRAPDLPVPPKPSKWIGARKVQARVSLNLVLGGANRLVPELAPGQKAIQV